MGSLGSEKKLVGYMDWNPQTKTRYWMQCVNEVLDQYKAYWPLTIRQIFYRLVANYEYSKTEQAYGRLINYLGRARRARVVPFNAIRDDGMRSAASGGWASVNEMLQNFEDHARHFSFERMATQPVRIEVFCEAAGMLPSLGDAVNYYGVSVYSGGGFNSLTTVRQTAQRVADDERDSIILQFGDYDPSGESIFDSFRQDVDEFVWQLTGQEKVKFVRMALTGEQVREMGIPTAPPKSTDSRSANWVGDTAQLEAIPPNELADMARKAVIDNYDMAKFDEIIEKEDKVSVSALEEVKRMRENFYEEFADDPDYGLREDEDDDE